MWQATAADGRVFTGRSTPWPDVPRDAKLTSLTYRGAVALRDCEAYGFQHFDLSTMEGALVTSGAQLLGRRGDFVVVIEIDDQAGTVVSRLVPASEITYNPELWR